MPATQKKQTGLVGEGVDHPIPFTVVIPLFNKAPTIERAVNSVLRQRHRHFELIVVDDGSTDGSADALATVNDPRLMLIRQSNGGVSAARNRGVELASHAHIAFLDADDVWHAGFLAAISALVQAAPHAVLFSARHDVVLPSGERILGSLSLPGDHCGCVANFYATYRKSQSLINSSSVCVLRDALLEVGGFPFGQRVGEDVVIWLKLAALGNVMFDARVLSTAHQDAENRTAARESTVVPYYLKYFLLDHDGRSQTAADAELMRFLAHYCLIYSAESARRGNRSVVKWYAQAIWPYDKAAAAACWAVGLAPAPVISFAKWVRHRLSKVRSAAV